MIPYLGCKRSIAKELLACMRPFPVYFSEYECSDKRFELAWEKDVVCRLTKKDSKVIRKTERLFWNGVKL